MRISLAYVPLFCLLPGLLAAQRVQKVIVLHNGYEEGRLVRNHTEVHYLHNSRDRTEGFVIVDRVIEYAVNKEKHEYSNWIDTDTLCYFSGTIRKGRKNGTFLTIPPGNLFFVTTYVNNDKTGLIQGFYHFGQLYCEGTLFEGVKVGPYREYYANGHLARAQNYLDLNQSVLHQEDYYLNGKLHQRGYYHDGNKVNEWQYFDASGMLSKTEYYNKYGRLRKVKSKREN